MFSIFDYLSIELSAFSSLLGIFNTFFKHCDWTSTL